MSVSVQGETPTPEILSLQNDIALAIGNTEVNVDHLELIARRLTEQVNLQARHDKDLDITIPNAVVKIFAVEFTNEAGKKKKRGELHELIEAEANYAQQGGQDPVELLEEVGDVVGKYALGIRHVADFQGEGDHWKDFPKDLCNALGYDYKTALLAYIAKYGVRVAKGKDDILERAAVTSLLGQRGDLVVNTRITADERNARISDLIWEYEIEFILMDLSTPNGKGFDIDLSTLSIEENQIPTRRVVSD